MKDDLGEKIMAKFPRLRAKPYSYLSYFQLLITVVKIKKQRTQKGVDKKKT